MFYIIYKTVNKINNKYYIGAHSARSLNDNYLGSGVALKRAIEKYGKENFYRENILLCDSLDEMYKIEEKIIKEHYLKEDCYNMNLGGKGGWNYVNSNGICKGENNVMLKHPEIKRKIIEKGKKTRSKNPEKYKKISIENLKKATEKNKGKKRPKHSEFMQQFSKKNWEENKEKMRDIFSSTFKVTSPEGVEVITNRLQEWCIKNNLPYTTIWKSSTLNGKIIKQGKAKGWKCELIRTNRRRINKNKRTD